MITVLSLLGYIIAVVMAIVAFTCWRKAMGFHALLSEVVARFEAAKKQAQQLDRDRVKATEKLTEIKDQLAKAEKQLANLKSKYEQELKRSEQQLEDAQQSASSSTLKLEHMQQQVAAMTSQLQEADFNLKELQIKYSHVKAEVQAEAKIKISVLEEKLTAVERKLRESEQQLVVAQAKKIEKSKDGAEITPEKARAYARKAFHFEHLYKSMRGLREMADERNKNWEVALQKLGTYIVSTKKPSLDTRGMTIGPIVGEALALIGEQLVHDEFSPTNTRSANNTKPADQTTNV